MADGERHPLGAYEARLSAHRLCEGYLTTLDGDLKIFDGFLGFGEGRIVRGEGAAEILGMECLAEHIDRQAVASVALNLPLVVGAARAELG